jgi:hypothetical protein
VQHLLIHSSSSAQRTWDNGSSAEAVQIGRLKRACAIIDCYWDIQCGCSDEGDPWCAVYDWGQDRAILHVARIDGRYLVAFPLSMHTSSTATLQAAIDAALIELAKSTSRGCAGLAM